MSQLRAREVDELTDYDETFKRRLVDLHWLMYFFEDGQPMVIYANFSGIQASLAGRALAKVTTFRYSGLRNPDNFQLCRSLRRVFHCL